MSLSKKSGLSAEIMEPTCVTGFATDFDKLSRHGCFMGFGAYEFDSVRLRAAHTLSIHPGSNTTPIPTYAARAYSLLKFDDRGWNELPPTLRATAERHLGQQACAYCGEVRQSPDV